MFLATRLQRVPVFGKKESGLPEAPLSFNEEKGLG
jgi:hypothetical protein